MNQTNFLTVEDAATRLQVTPYTMRKWLRTGRVGGVKMGKFWRVPESSLRDLAASATTLKPSLVASPAATKEDIARLLEEMRAGRNT